MLQVGTYRTSGGELVHLRLDVSGTARVEVERADGSLRDGCEVCDCDVLLSDDPDWPSSDLRARASLLIVD